MALTGILSIHENENENVKMVQKLWKADWQFFRLHIELPYDSVN